VIPITASGIFTASNASAKAADVPPHGWQVFTSRYRNSISRTLFSTGMSFGVVVVHSQPIVFSFLQTVSDLFDVAERKKTQNASELFSTLGVANLESDAYMSD
jgi:hypothetical protein